MYILDDNKKLNTIEETTFSDLSWKESDIEEMLRKNIDLLCEEEESLLIVGQQVKDSANTRNDLTAIDNNGNLVLIEVKRDKNDITARKEPLEFQAIRYAASCATIRTTDELEQKIFKYYIAKYKEEYTVKFPGFSEAEIAKRILNDFKDKNEIKTFNERQRIILVASEFDEHTLSAVAWLISNKVDISCFVISPYILDNSKTLIDVKKILPIIDYSDYYIDFPDKEGRVSGAVKTITRTTLPKIKDLLGWKVVEPGDILIAKDTDDKVVLQNDGRVKKDGAEEILSLQQWLKNVYGWQSVETYRMAIQEKSGKSLSDLRKEYMESHPDEV